MFRVEILSDGTHVVRGLDRNGCAAYVASLTSSIPNFKECVCTPYTDGSYHIHVMVMAPFSPIIPTPVYPQAVPEVRRPVEEKKEDDDDDVWKSEQAQSLSEHDKTILSKRMTPTNSRMATPAQSPKRPRNTGGAPILPTLKDRISSWRPPFSNAVSVSLEKK